MSNKAKFVEKFVDVQPGLKNFANKLAKNTEDAKDLVQETALKSYSNYDRFEKGSNFKAWTYTILRNTFINNYRKAKNRPFTTEAFDNMLAITANKKIVENKGFSALRVEELEAIFSNLKDIYAVPFKLYHQGYKYHEIARRLNLPLGTVKSRIHTARRKLKDQI